MLTKMNGVEKNTGFKSSKRTTGADDEYDAVSVARAAYEPESNQKQEPQTAPLWFGSKPQPQSDAGGAPATYTCIYCPVGRWRIERGRIGNAGVGRGDSTWNT